MPVFFRILILLSGMVFLASCSDRYPIENSHASEIPEYTWVGTLRPYHTPSLTPTSLPPTSLMEPTATPVPTSTPFIHQVKKGETMLGIAIQYGVALEELRAANPEADPRLLSVGQVLVVPIRIEEETNTAAATPTPLQMAVESPRCFVDGQTSVCIAEIVNNQPVILDSVQVRFDLFDLDGNILGSTISTISLSRIFPDESMPVLAVFENEVSVEEYFVQVQVLNAFQAIDSGAARSDGITLEILEESIAVTGRSVQVSGRVSPKAPASQVWLLGVVYDRQNQAVGMRKIKLQTGCSPTPAAQQTENPETETTPAIEKSLDCPWLEFDFTIFSLGPEISRVSVFGEARP